MRRRSFVLGAAAIALGSYRASAGDLPVNFQAIFLLRVLAYDRNLKTRAGDAAGVVVVYSEKESSPKDDILAALAKIAKEAKVADLPIRVSAVAYSNANDVDAAILNAKASALYVCPGLDAAVAPLSQITRKRSVLSFTGVEPWVQEGVAVALVARESKPGIVVNLAAAKAEGADLDPALLRLAEVIR